MSESESGSELLVDHAMEAVVHRVLPDARVADVADILVREELHALPVVGEDSELLGIVTSGDVLDAILPEGGGGPPAVSGGDELTARDIMTRTVLSVSKGGSLMEAASKMRHKDVEQLTVVRDGRLVGLLTRNGVLRALRTLGTDRAES